VAVFKIQPFLSFFNPTNLFSFLSQGVIMGFLKKEQTGGKQARRNFKKNLTNGAYRLPIKEGLKASKWPSGHRKKGMIASHKPL